MDRKKQPRSIAANNISRTLGKHHPRARKRGIHAEDTGRHGFAVWAEPLNGGIRVQHSFADSVPAMAARDRQRMTRNYADILRREGYLVRIDGRGIESTAFIYGHSWDEGMLVTLCERIRVREGETIQRLDNRIAVDPGTGLVVGIEVDEQIATVVLISEQGVERIGADRRMPHIIALVNAARRRAKGLAA